MGDSTGSGVYQILNKVNGKRYIGSSKNLNTRLMEHANFLRKNKHHSILLQRAWNKYGEKAFEFKVIEYINKSYIQTYLRDREQHFIDLYDSSNKNKGYNISKKAQSVDIPPYIRTEEHRKEMSEKLSGRILTERWKQRISRTRIERNLSNGRQGKKFGNRLITIQKRKQIEEFVLKNGYRPTAESIDVKEKILGQALANYINIKRPDYNEQFKIFISQFPTRKQFYQKLKREVY